MGKSDGPPVPDRADLHRSADRLVVDSVSAAWAGVFHEVGERGRPGDKDWWNVPLYPLSYRTVDGGPGGSRTRDLVSSNDVVPPAFAG